MCRNVFVILGWRNLPLSCRELLKMGEWGREIIAQRRKGSSSGGETPPRLRHGSVTHDGVNDGRDTLRFFGPSREPDK